MNYTAKIEKFLALHPPPPRNLWFSSGVPRLFRLRGSYPDQARSQRAATISETKSHSKFWVFFGQVVGKDQTKKNILAVI